MVAKSKFMEIVNRIRASKVKSYKVTKKRMKSLEEW